MVKETSVEGEHPGRDEIVTIICQSAPLQARVPGAEGVAVGGCGEPVGEPTPECGATCTRILGGDGEVTWFSCDAVNNSGTVRRHIPTRD